MDESSPTGTSLRHGEWPSPITADLIVQAAVSIGELHVGTDDVWWSEQRPAEDGRIVVVRHRPGGEDLEITPAAMSVRTRVHEYGGGAWWLHDDALFFVSWADQRLYRADGDEAPRPLTPATDPAQSARYADGRVTVDGRWVICVRELHAAGGEPRNEIVAIDAHPDGEPAEPVVLHTGPDFVSFPRISSDGTKLCWTQWNHPHMPWDASELWVAELASEQDHVGINSPRRVAGGDDESIFQPSWSADGDLLFVSDRRDWSNLYRIAAADLATDNPEGRLVAPVEGDIAAPQWVFDQSRYCELDDGRLLCVVSAEGLDHLAVIDPVDGRVDELSTTFTSFASLRRFGEGAAAIAASATEEPTVVVLDIPGRGEQRPCELAPIRAGRDLEIDRCWFSLPEPLAFDVPGGARAYALYYPPTNPEVADGLVSDRPPLIVLSHGGPTSAARSQLNLTIQYWTSRGLAVVDVNYRGSTGYGRAFRRSLDGAWGVADVEDCIAAADHLAARGDVDPDRLAIRGGSAGGYTTLCALTFHDRFAAGASLYGVADLETLARDTHKFESRYLDSLIGPYPERRDLYVERSPVHHTDHLNCPIILFQGLEDAIVPPSQAEEMVAALDRNRVPYAYLTFEGEQHGFRQAASIKRVLEAELYFYSRVFRFDTADDLVPVAIQNL